MNIVIAKHDGCDKPFVWEVPEQFQGKIKDGDTILVETKRGNQLATVDLVVKESIPGQSEKLAKMLGAKLPLKKVIGHANIEMTKYISDRATSKFVGDIVKKYSKELF